MSFIKPTKWKIILAIFIYFVMPAPYRGLCPAMPGTVCPSRIPFGGFFYTIELIHDDIFSRLPGAFEDAKSLLVYDIIPMLIGTYLLAAIIMYLIERIKKLRKIIS